MPHTARKKRQQYQHSNRKVTTLDNGWTRVSYKVAGPGNHGWSVTERELPPQDPALTVAKLHKEFDDHLAKWRGSEGRRHLRKIVSTCKELGGEKAKVSNAVMLALGSVTRVLANTRQASLWQLVGFLDVVSMLEEDNGGTKIQLVAQEPVFTDLDVEFLQDKGFTIVNIDDDRTAITYVNSSTFLYVPSLEWTTENPFRLKGVECPLYFTSRMEWVIDEAERMTELFDAEVTQALKGARAIQKSHREFVFPESELTDALHTTIYVKTYDDEGC